MRLDAAKLTKCFGSCFRQKLLPEVQGGGTPRASEEPALRRVFSFLGTTLLLSMGKNPAPNVKNFNKYAIIRDKTPKALFQPVLSCAELNPVAARVWLAHVHARSAKKAPQVRDVCCQSSP